ncbi:VOC family protein [Pseudonocardia petroleophila]|uniref:VOC family protein n=1 Tax=Pseudonocardia petroleophila TaxID=37331 RepID=UPI0031CE4D2A
MPVPAPRSVQRCFEPDVHPGIIGVVAATLPLHSGAGATREPRKGRPRPHRLARFWTAALGAEPITTEPDLVEARLRIGDDLFLDLCFPRVTAPSDAPARLHPDLAGGARPQDVVRRLLDLGAEPADIGQGDVPWTVLTDPEGNAFCVLAEHERDTGPIAALPLDSADPGRDAAFWAGITGWVPAGATALRHPSGVGPLLQLWPEPEPKRGKNRLHLDVRPDAGDGDVVDRVLRSGGTTSGAPSDHPWRVCADPSGNEFCVLSMAQGGERVRP